MSKKLHIRTFGCQMNVYDSDKMAALMHQRHGMELCERMEEADLIVFNTCSVREKAQEKVFSDLGRAHDLKRIKPDLLIAVGGCVASQEGDAIVERAPYVDVVFGPQTLHRLPDLVEQRLALRQPQVDIRFPEIEKFDALPAVRSEGPTAFVSVMEGCSKFCSFCVVPYTRGEEFSRPVAAVIAEITQLARQGVREVTLLGQNVNAYLGETEADEADFAALLEQVAMVPGIEWIRYTSSHPLEVTPSLIAAHGRIPALAGQIHLPVQSGSDRILAAMKRGYDAAEYLERLHGLRSARPGLSVTSDFIVGFPGETEADFKATLELVERADFDGGYGFLYSPRPGTPAADRPDDVPSTVKQARLHRLLKKLDAQAEVFSRAMIGTRQRVLVDGHSKRDPSQLRGRTDNNRVVNFAGNDRLLGHFVDIEITAIATHTLRGRLADVS